MGVARTVYIRRAVSRVLSSSSLHATSSILFGISTSSPFPPFPPFPPYLRIGDARLAPPVSVRHVRPTLSVSLCDTSVRRCPSPCPTRPSDVVRSCPTRPSDAVRLSVRHVVRSCPTRPSDAVRLSVRHVRLTLSVSVSRFRSRSRSIPVPVPVPPPASAPALACVTRTHSSTLENRLLQYLTRSALSRVESRHIRVFRLFTFPAFLSKTIHTRLHRSIKLPS